MRSRLEASLEAGAVAIVLNTAALKLADVISLPTAHGGLLRLISPWLAGPLNWSGLTALWQRIGGPPVSSTLFQTGFHLAVGMGMAVFYAFAVEPVLKGRTIAKALAYAAAVWLLNAAVVLPLTGEGFAGSEHLSFAGMAWFAAAHTLFFLILALLYRALRAQRKSSRTDTASS
ncbi:hypothetical protein [Bradyrhizobium cenepequi]